MGGRRKGERRGDAGGEEALCGFCLGGKSQEIKGQRSRYSREGTKAINQQRGGKGASECPLEKRPQDQDGWLAKLRVDPLREVITRPGALTRNRAVWWFRLVGGKKNLTMGLKFEPPCQALSLCQPEILTAKG